MSPSFTARPLRSIVSIADSGTWGDTPTSGPGFPVLRSSNIQNARLVLDEVALRDIPAKHIESKRLANGDIIVTTSSGSPSHIGKCTMFYAPDDRAFYFSNFTMRLRATTDTDARWLFYWLSSERGRAVLDAMNNTTSGLRNLNKGLYLAQKVPCPPLAEQCRIATILDKADAMRRRRQEAISLTEELLRSTFLETFGDPVTNPKRWPERPLDHFGTITTGNTPSRKVAANYGSHIEWIKTDNITGNNDYVTPATECLSAQGRTIGREVPAGAILMACIAGSLSSIGKVAIADRSVTFNQQINAILPSAAMSTTPFLYTMLKLGQRRVQDISTGGMKGIVSKGRLSKLRMMFPPIETQRRMDLVFAHYIGLRRRYEDGTEQADALFHSLVQRAFRGDL